MATNMEDIYWELGLQEDAWREAVDDGETLERLMGFIADLGQRYPDAGKQSQTLPRLKVLEGLFKQTDFSVYTSEEHPNLGEVTAALVPPLDSPKWMGRTPNIRANQSRMIKEGFIEKIQDETGKDIGLKATELGLLVALYGEVVGRDALLDWFMTEGEGHPDPFSSKTKVKRYGRNALAEGNLGRFQDTSVHMLETVPWQKLFDNLDERVVGWIVMGFYTYAGNSEHQKEGIPTADVSQVMKWLSAENGQKCFNWLHEANQSDIAKEVVQMGERYSLSSAGAEIIVDRFMQERNPYKELVDWWVGSPHSDMDVAEDEVRDMVLRYTWNIVRRVMDFRMNDHRYALETKPTVSGQLIEEFIHRVALAKDVHFESVTDVDGKRKKHDVVLDGVGYDLKTLTEKRGNHDQ